MQFFGPNLSKRLAVFSLKQVKQTPSLNFAYSITLCIRFHSEQTILNFWSKFAQERYGQSKKMNIIIEFGVFKSLGTKFSWPDLSKKVFPSLKQRKWTPHFFYIILHIQISLVRNFSSNWQFSFFRPNLPKKVFPVENRKSEHHHIILHIWNSLGAKFQLKLNILRFWTKFTKKKGISSCKKNKQSKDYKRLLFFCSKR